MVATPLSWVFYVAYSYYQVQEDWLRVLSQKVEETRGLQASATHEVVDRYGITIGRFSENIRTQLDKNECLSAKWLRTSVVAFEDRRFFKHPGVDIQAFARATVRNRKSLSLREGASTITQQLARTLMKKPLRTIRRMVTETLFALDIETILDKNTILCLYINSVYVVSESMDLAKPLNTILKKHHKI